MARPRAATSPLGANPRRVSARVAARFTSRGARVASAQRAIFSELQ